MPKQKSQDKSICLQDMDYVQLSEMWNFIEKVNGLFAIQHPNVLHAANHLMQVEVKNIHKAMHQIEFIQFRKILCP